MTDGTGNFLVFLLFSCRFEDMKKDLSRETAKILKFLNISLPNDELERRLSKDLGAFKR